MLTPSTSAGGFLPQGPFYSNFDNLAVQLRPINDFTMARVQH